MAANLTEPEIPEWMKKALECPVCLDIIMDPPVFICENSQGHSMCFNCHKSIQLKDKICPVCRGPMENRRNVCLESLVESMPNKVTCRSEGCHFKRSKEAVVAKHEESCEYRLVPCGQCDSKVTVEQLSEHVASCGGNGKLDFAGVSVWSNNWRIPKTMRCQQVMKSTADQSMTFLLNWHTMGDSVKVFWISYIGPRDIARTFRYTFKVLPGPDPVLLKPNVLEVTRKCVPCDLSFEEVKRQMCAVFLDKETLEEAREGTEDDKIGIQLMIEKVLKRVMP